MPGSTDPAILAFIRSQPQAVRDAAAAALATAPAPAPAPTLLFGCGTSYHAACLAVGPGAWAQPAYEVWQHAPGPAAPGRAVAVSHSGGTAATVRAAERARSLGAAEVVAVTCRPDGPLGQVCDRAVTVPAADETVGPKTKGYAASAAAVLALVEAAAGLDGVAARAEAAARDMEAVLDADRAAFEGLLALARAARHLWLLGGGPLRSVAREGALKVAEMAAFPARALEQEEFLHGWRRAADRDHLVVALAPAGGETERLDELARMCAEQGARLAVVQGAGAPALARADLTLALPAAPAPGPWAALAYVVPLQILAYAMGTPGAEYWP